jgi:hypothetical protein
MIKIGVFNNRNRTVFYDKDWGLIGIELFSMIKIVYLKEQKYFL